MYVGLIDDAAGAGASSIITGSIGSAMPPAKAVVADTAIAAAKIAVFLNIRVFLTHCVLIRAVARKLPLLAAKITNCVVRVNALRAMNPKKYGKPYQLSPILAVCW
jgi:hypothetical protein